MRRILAIAVLAIRSAIRSRIVILLLAILVPSVVGLPLTVRDDGTLAGRVQLLLGYTLGLASLILSIATVWAACGAVSAEVQNRQIHLVATKPVHRAQIWLGKWLGLMIINAVLLGICGATVYALLRWNTRPGVLSDADRTTLRDEILTGRLKILPQPVDVEDAARRELERAQKQGLIPPNVPPAQAYQAIRQALLTRAFAVPPGAKREWVFRAPEGGAGDQPLVFRFRLSSSAIGLEKVTGLWRVQRRGSPTWFEHRDESVPGAARSFKVPASAAARRESAPPRAAGGGDLVVEYANVSEEPVTVLFPPEDGLTLLVYRTTFEANLARALLVILARLAFIAALGVTAGSLFSMPVAAFASLGALLVVLAGGYIGSMAGQEAFFGGHGMPDYQPGFWDLFFRVFFKVMNVVVSPLRGPSPLDQLAAGELISGAWLAHAVLLQGLLYGGALALLGAWILNRREIALPAG